MHRDVICVAFNKCTFFLLFFLRRNALMYDSMIRIALMRERMVHAVLMYVNMIHIVLVYNPLSFRVQECDHI